MKEGRRLLLVWVRMVAASCASSSAGHRLAVSFFISRSDGRLAMLGGEVAGAQLMWFEL